MTAHHKYSDPVLNLHEVVHERSVSLPSIGHVEVYAQFGCDILVSSLTFILGHGCLTVNLTSLIDLLVSLCLSLVLR